MFAGPGVGCRRGSPEQTGNSTGAAAVPTQAASLRLRPSLGSLDAEPRLPAPGRAVPYPVCDKTAPRRFSMSWLVLVVSGVLEAVWATSLSRSDGLSRLAPSITFVVSLVASMAGLAYAMRDLP